VQLDQREEVNSGQHKLFCTAFIYMSRHRPINPKGNSGSTSTPKFRLLKPEPDSCSVGKSNVPVESIRRVESTTTPEVNSGPKIELISKHTDHAVIKVGDDTVPLYEGENVILLEDGRTLHFIVAEANQERITISSFIEIGAN